jgi:hypothetical protein
VIGSAEHVQENAIYGELIDAAAQFDHLSKAAEVSDNLVVLADDALEGGDVSMNANV